MSVDSSRFTVIELSNSAVIVRKINSIINGRGDSVTKVLKCKDILTKLSDEG